MRFHKKTEFRETVSSVTVIFTTWANYVSNAVTRSISDTENDKTRG